MPIERWRSLRSEDQFIEYRSKSVTIAFRYYTGMAWFLALSLIAGLGLGRVVGFVVGFILKGVF